MSAGLIFSHSSWADSLSIGKSIALWNSEVPQKELLLVSLGGTNSVPSDMLAVDEEALKIGFRVLAVDYDNHVISTTCQDSKDILCFDHFRAEVVQGHRVSNLLDVPPEQSIIARIQFLLQTMAQKDPVRWQTFIKKDKIQWHKIVALGHSQGSGHVAFLAQLRRLRGVIVIAGPQDRFSDGRRVTWLHRESQTPRNRYFFLLHEKDFFGSQHQRTNALTLLDGKHPMNVIVINEEVKDPHMALIQPLFASYWKELLEKVLAP